VSRKKYKDIERDKKRDSRESKKKETLKVKERNIGREECNKKIVK